MGASGVTTEDLPDLGGLAATVSRNPPAKDLGRKSQTGGDRPRGESARL